MNTNFQAGSRVGFCAGYESNVTQESIKDPVVSSSLASSTGKRFAPRVSQSPGYALAPYKRALCWSHFSLATREPASRLALQRLRTFRPKVDSPDDVSPGLKSIPKDKTLYNTVKMLIRVVLVKLGFHMCSPRLYACSLFRA